MFKRKDPLEGDTWVADGLSFSCTQCGNCCTGPAGFVWFSEEEALAMAQFLDMDIADFRARYARKAMGKWTLGEVRRGKDHDCVFLTEFPDGKRTCSIYPVRPMQCRTWPFWPSNLTSREAWEDSARTCPGMRDPDARGDNFVPIDQIRITLDKNPHHL